MTMFQALSSNLKKALDNACRIKGQKGQYGRDWARVCIYSSTHENRLFVEATNNSVTLTQQVGAKIETDGQVVISHPKDFKKWLPKESRIDFDGVFRDGERIYDDCATDYDWAQSKHIEEEEADQILGIAPSTLWDVLLNARKYGDIDGYNTVNHYVHFRIDADGRGEYVITTAYAFFKAKIHFMGADAPCEFSLHIEALEAILTAIKEPKGFYSSEILLTVKGNNATIQTRHIKSTGAKWDNEGNLFKDPFAIFDSVWKANAKDVVFVETNHAPADKYKKTDLSYWCNDSWETAPTMRPFPKYCMQRIYIPDSLYKYSVGFRDGFFTIFDDDCQMIASGYTPYPND